MLDTILTVVLIVVVPGYVFLRDHLAKGKPPLALKVRYGLGLAMTLALMTLCALTWGLGGRSLATLGLDVPPSIRGWIGLAIAACLLGAFAFLALSGKVRPPSGESDAASALMPKTPSERRLAIVFFIGLGVSWEVLYRGYLLWALTPHIGLIGAIVVAALAYGLAHGFKGWRQLGASLVVALVFTIAYAVAGSLWWLMIIHAGLPLVALLAARPGADDAPPTTLSTEAPHPA